MSSVVKHFDNKTHIAAFDFDGTCIKKSSGLLLVHYLGFRGYLSAKTLTKISKWAFDYAAHKHTDDSDVRALVFEAFLGKPKEQVDRFLELFYKEKIAPIIKQKALAQMELHHQNNDAVIIVSAAFEPIVRSAREDIPYDDYIALGMCVDNQGCYTNKMTAQPITGEQKWKALSEFADKKYGAGNWVLDYAYGDHHSDKYILIQARNAFVVDGDHTLRRLAKNYGWATLAWK